MDGQQQESQQKKHPLSFLQEMEWTGGGILLGIVFFLAVFLTLNYFNILRLWQLYPNQLGFLPHRAYQTTNQPIKPQPIPPTPTPAKLILSCPVPKEFCNSGKITTYQGDPALVYKLASGSSVLSATQINNELDIDFFTNSLKKTKTIFTSHAQGNICFVITYTLPFDATFTELTLFPFQKAQKLAAVTSTMLTLNESDEANVIMQVRKMKIDQTTPCTIKRNEKKESGIFQKIETIEII